MKGLFKTIIEKKNQFMATLNNRERRMAEEELHRLREEAAERITMRKVIDIASGRVNGVVICLDGVIIYETDSSDTTVSERVFSLRETYVELMSPNPSIGLL